jgi:cytochrome c oxidase subunit 4
MLKAQQDMPAASEIAHLLRAWLLVLLLGAAEFAASFLPLTRSLRPLVMIPGVLMVVVVAVRFMEVRKGPSIIRAFAAAGIFWLFVLLALGSVDPLTRSDYRLAPASSMHLQPDGPHS